MLTNFLGLTDAQKAAATDIFTALATAEQPLFESQQAERKIIADSVKTNATGAIDAAASQLGQVEGQLAALRGKAEAKFYAVLTTDQKTKYDSRPMRGPGGFGGPGGPPPPPRGGH
jgi:Spy/CpxP family protein refolding chaperone